MANKLVEADTGSTLQVTIKDDVLGTVIDLTPFSVRLNFKSDNVKGVFTTRTMTVASPVTGIATYKFVGNELAPGELEFEVKLVNTSNQEEISSLETVKLDVRRRLR